MILDGKAYINQFELYLNISSLMGLVLGIDILSFLTKISKYLKLKLNSILTNLLTKELIDKLIFIISWFIMILLFILSIYQSNIMAKDYLNKKYKNYYKVIYPGFQPFNVHICFPLTEMIKGKKFKIDDYKFNKTNNLNRFKIENKLLRDYLTDKTLSYLIKNTYNLTQVLNKTYFTFGLKRKYIEIKNNISNSFFRQHILFDGERTNIYVKCFTLKLELQINGYENLFTSARLVMIFNFEKMYFYLTEIDQTTISSTTKPLLENREIVKRIKKKRSNCFDYSKLSCKSKSNCFDQCSFNTIFKKKKQLVLNHLNLKDYKKYLDYQFYLKFINKDKIRNCYQLYQLGDCNQVIYDAEKTHWHISGIKNIKIIHTVFRNIFETEVEISKNWDLFFNLLNLYSVLLGINIQNLMNLILKLFELKIDLKNFRRKTNKIFKILFFILFILSVYYTCKITFKNEMNTSFSIKNSPLIHLFPDINICFDYEQKDFNQTKLTGYDLDNLTNYISFDNIFEYFIVLDHTNIEITLKPPYKMKSKHLKLSHFYFLNKKCLRIRYNFKFIINRITNFKYPLRLKFNQLRNFYYYYYCSNYVNRKTLSTLNRLSFKESYEIYLDKIQFSYNDVFEEFKNPLLFFKSIRYLDFEFFIDKLSYEIVDKINHTTRWIPLNDRRYFGHYINDTLFEIHFNKFKEKEQSFFSQNFKYKFLKDRVLRTPAGMLIIL